jgi:hypothetical protein
VRWLIGGGGDGSWAVAEHCLPVAWLGVLAVRINQDVTMIATLERGEKKRAGRVTSAIR